MDMPIRSGVLFSSINDEDFTLPIIYELLSHALYYHRLFVDKSWIRRRVETIKFVDQLTLRRKVTFEIDRTRLAQYRALWNIEGISYLPLVSGMIPEPLLDIDLVDEKNESYPLAKRRENAEVTALSLLGYILFGLQRRFNANAQQLKVHLWAHILYKWLFKTQYYENYLPVEQESSFRESLPDDMPPFVEDFLDRMRSVFRGFLGQYTLSIVAGQNESREVKLIKLSYLARLHSNTRGEVQNRGQKTGPRHGIFSLFGTSYLLPLPGFGQHNGACHARIDAPDGVVIDDAHLLKGYSEFSINRERLFDSNTTVHYWEPIKYRDQSTDDFHAEMIFDRRRVEVHDHQLSKSVVPAQSEMSIWQLKIDVNPVRSRFHVPAIALLAPETALLLNANFIGKLSGVDDSLTQSLGLFTAALLGYVLIPKEHETLTQMLRGPRFFVGTAGVLDFIALATNLDTPIRGVIGIISLTACLFLLWHILRIEAARSKNYRIFYEHARIVCHRQLGAGRPLLRYLFSWRVLSDYYTCKYRGVWITRYFWLGLRDIFVRIFWEKY